MDAEQIVQVVITEMECGNMDLAAEYLSEDMIFSGPVPHPVGKQEFLAIQGALMAAIPDWSFNLMLVRVEEERVLGTVQITGTHTETLRLPMPGVPPVPATGLAISLPTETVDFLFDGDQIAEIRSEPVPGGGVPGVLAQLGIELPMPARD